MADLDPIRFAPGDVDITLTPPDSPQAVGVALAANQPFPDNAFTNGAIALGSIGAKASKDFNLKGAGGDSKVKFLESVTVGGKLFAGFGVYRSVDKLIEDLTAQGLAEELNEPAVNAPIFPAPPPPRDYYALRWGYEASADAKGSLPLGGVLPPITFGGSARKAGLYAIVRAQAPDAKSLDAVTDTLNSWTLPQKVTSPDGLKPGTWVIAENDGSVKFNLGLEYGYDYSWVRESLKVGGLSGNLGLKIEMGVKAGLGFTASGRYATVVSRESDRAELRLRVFRMRQHGWTFNFNATVGAQLEVDDKLFPAKFEDFIKGIFNVNGNQVLKDFVDTFDKWSDPNSSLADLLGAELIEQAKALFARVTGKDPATEFEAGRALLTQAIDRWRGLPHELSSMLYGLLRKQGVPLDDLRDFLGTVKGLTDPKRLADEITSRVEAARFYESPVGKWLTAVAKGTITDLLTGLDIKQERERLVALADKTVALLDGSKVETLIRELQTWIEDQLGLDKIMAVTATSFKDIDKWLKKRLADFLDKTLGEVVFADVKKIQQAIQTLRDNAQKFFEKGREALTQKYKAEFDFSYAKTTTKTALVDVTFDFAANATNASARLKEALKGDFTKLLSEAQAGVRLHKGVLTHGIKRNTHLAVGLPFFKSAVDHITTSEARVNIVDTDGGGRLWVFNLKAEDVVSKKHALSKLSISLEFSRMMGVRKFSGEELSDDVFRYNYQLRMVRRGARRAFLENKVGPLAEQYLASEFKAAGKGDFSTYLTTLDKLLDDTGLEDNDFGNLLVGFDVSMPSGAFAAWKNAPAEKNHDTYIKMSVDMQRMLRGLTLDAYTQDEDNFKAPQRKKMYPLLAYCGLPDINKLRFKTASQRLEFSTDAVLDWDPRNGDLRNKLFAEHCAKALRTVILPGLEKELKGNDAALQMYAPTTTNIENILNFNVGSASDRKEAVSNFESLALGELTRINAVRDAAVKFGKSLGASKPEEAMKNLAEFGASLVNSFNQGVNERYAGTEYRPFGTLLFAETAKAFGATAEQTRPVAVLELLVLPKDTAYNLKDFLTDNRPGDDVKLLHEARVVTSPD